MSVPIFAPPQGPSYPLVVDPVFLVDRDDTNSGLEVARPLGQLMIRRARPQWPRFAVPTREYIQSFLEGLAGTNGPIQWTMPDEIASPTGWAPTLADAAGGALPSRDYDVWVTWYSTQTTQETAVSAMASITVDANKLLVVTIPPAPNGVDAWRVYVDDGAAINQELQATITTSRTWTEPSGGMIAGASPPSSSALKPPIKWVIESIAGPTLIRRARWSFEMVLLEQLI